MASDTANFEANLTGDFARKAKKNARATGVWVDEMGRARHANGRFANSFKLLGKNGAISKKSLKKLGITALATTAALAAVGYAAYKMGGAIAGRVEETEAMVFALDRLTHHGEQSFGEMRDMAQDLGLDIDKTAKSYASFLKLQFPESEAKKLINLGADMQALGNSADDIQGIFRALGQIRSKGRVQAEEMLQLAERGVSQSLVYESLAKNRGLDKGQAGVDQIRKLQEAGEISAQEFFVSFEEAINKKLGQSEAGESAKKFVEETFKGSKNKLKAQATDFWITITEHAKPGMKDGFDALSDGLADFFESSEQAERFERIMTGIGTGFRITGEALAYLLPKAIEAADVFGIAFADGYEEFGGKGATSNEVLTETKKLIDLLIPVAEALGKTFGAIAASLEAIGKAQSFMAKVADPGTALYNWVEGDPDEKPPALRAATLDEQDRETAENKGLATGAAWGDGLSKGMESKMGEVSETAARLAAVMDTSGREEIDAHSPARKAATMAGDWGDGIVVGLDGKQGAVAGAGADLAGVMGGPVLPGGKAPGNLKGGKGGAISIGDITIMVEGSSDPEQTAQATLRAFERNLGASLGRIAGEVAA